MTEGFGFGRVGVGPGRDSAHQDLEIVYGADGDLTRTGIPPAATLSQAASQRLEARGRTGNRRLARHQRAPAQCPRQPDELIGSGGALGREQGVQPLEILPRLEGEEVGHCERRAGRVGHNRMNIRKPSAFSHRRPAVPVAEPLMADG